MALVKYNNNSISAITTAGQLASGGMVLIKEQIASSSSSVSFVDGSSSVVLDSTYPIYLFKFLNMHPSDSGTNFRVNFSTDSGSNYNVTKTTTAFASQHFENDSSTSLAYQSGQDLAQSTNPQMFMILDNASDSGGSGELYLFNPSSTTFVKHFIARCNVHKTYSSDNFTAGYLNTTSAVNAVKFEMESGNIDSGTIKMYGVV